MAQSTLKDGKKAEALLICTRITLMAASMESDFKYCIFFIVYHFKKNIIRFMILAFTPVFKRLIDYRKSFT